MQYYLIDVERSVISGHLNYWKANKYGYTTCLHEAGLFSEEKADKLVKEDYNNMTVKVNPKFIKRKIEELNWRL